MPQSRRFGLRIPPGFRLVGSEAVGLKTTGVRDLGLGSCLIHLGG